MRRPRIVYYTSCDEGTLARLAAETGADGYLTMSTRTAQVVDAVRAHLTRE